MTPFGPVRDKKIVLAYDETQGVGHYDVVTTLTGYLGTSYFCYKCYKGYNDKGKHACKNNPEHCHACLQDGCVDFANRSDKPAFYCEKCGRNFYGTMCLQNHLTKSQDGKELQVRGSSVCETRKKCKECKKLLVGKKYVETHKCGHAECSSCGRYLPTDHHCYVQPTSKKERRKKKQVVMKDDDVVMKDDDDVVMKKGRLLVFFDIEARQDTGTHVANLLIAEKEDCEVPVVFRGEDCVKKFILWLDELSQDRLVNVIAHNLKGCDGYFIVDEYHKQHRIVRQLRNGAKLLSINVNRVCYTDSLSFFQMPLSNFTDTFGLTELKKGWFPHLFNTTDNENYVGPIPDKKYFVPESMSEKNSKEFESWYDQQVRVGERYDFAKELLEYCKSDVRLLKEGCLTFKRLFEKMTDFDPFEQITIASACMRDL